MAKRRPPPPPHGPFALVHEDNRVVMSVPLMGEIGTGHRMLLDVLQWDRVSALMGTEWTLACGPDGRAYVVSYRKQATALAGDRDGSAPLMRLARYLAGAGPDDVVTYLDGSSLNLTRRNLVVERRRDHWARSRSQSQQNRRAA